MEQRVLWDRHKQHLMETSGFSEETIRKLGWWSCDAKELARILRKAVHAWETGIAIPYPNVPGFVRVRYDVARLRKRPDGSVSEQRYDQPTGTGNHLYILPEVRQAIEQGTETIFITEGEKKAVKATQEGYPCIGVPGVWNVVERATDDHGRKTDVRIVLPELEELPWARRRVVIVWDSDARQKPQVMQAGQRLANILRKRGAEVRFHVLEAPPGKKVGLDDFLVEHGADGFREWLQRAVDESLNEGRNFEIERIRVIQTDPPIYDVTVFGKAIRMTSSMLLSFARFRARVLDATYRVVQFDRQKDWTEYVASIMATRIELEEAPAEASAKEQLWWEIRRYIASRMSEDPEVLADERGPYRNASHVYVHVSSLVRHLFAAVGKIDPSEVWAILRDKGGVFTRKWVKTSDGRWVQKRVCQLEVGRVVEGYQDGQGSLAPGASEGDSDDEPF